MQRRINRFIAVLTTTAVSSFGLVALAPAATADTPRCVSRKEFRKVDRGMRKQRVHRIFDTRGEFGDGGAGGYSRLYKVCRPGFYVVVEYADGPRRVARVSSKDWNPQEG